MKISDFRKAMRPKKYLTRDFVVYQDPKMLAARSEMQEGGRAMTVSEKFIKANRLKAKKAGEAASAAAEARKFDKPTAIVRGNPRKLVGIKYKNKAQEKRFEDLIKEKFKFPKKSKEGRKIDKKIIKEFNLSRDGFERAQRVVKNKYNLKQPEKVYIGPTAADRKKDKVRRIAKRRFSDPTMEAKFAGPKETGVQLSHMDNLYTEFVTGKNLGYAPAEINQSLLEDYDKKFKKLYNERAKIKRNKPKDMEAKLREINLKGMRLQGETQGFKTFKIEDPETGKVIPNPIETRFDIDPLDLLKGKTLKQSVKILPGKGEKVLDISDFDRELFEINRQNVIESVQKQSPKLVKEFKKNVVQGINESSPKDLTDFISTLAPGCKLKYADGGRVSYSTGSDCYNRGLEMLKQASQGDKTTAQKVGQSLKQFGKATGKLARFVELPLEIALEGLLIGWDSTFNAKPLDESIKDNGIVLRAIFSDFQTSGEQDRAANIAKQNPQAAKYVEAKEALDKYNKLKNTIDTFKDDLASADNYQNAVVKFEEYENKIEDKIPQYKAILTPGSPEYEAFKEARIGLARDRVEKTYGRAQEMEELLQPFAGTTDVADMQKAKAEEIQGRIEDISSIYNFGPTFEEFKKETLPRLYELSNKKQTPETDAMLEPLLRSQYNKNLKLFSRPQFSKGGLTRRGFLKVVGALTALAAAAKTGIMKITTPTAKKVLKDAPQGTPDWFAPLVEKIMKEGVDKSGTLGTIERETVKVLRNPKLNEAGNPMYVESLQKDGTVKKMFAKEDVYILRENSDTGEITVSINSADIGAHGDFVDFNMTPQRIEGITDDGTPIIEGGEFTIAESRATGRVTGPDDVDIELDEYITNDLDDAASDWHSVEEFATGKTNKKAQIEKQKRKEQIENNPVGDIEDRGGTMDNYEDYFDEDAMKYDYND